MSKNFVELCRYLQANGISFENFLELYKKEMEENKTDKNDEKKQL